MTEKLPTYSELRDLQQEVIELCDWLKVTDDGDEFYENFEKNAIEYFWLKSLYEKLLSIRDHCETSAS